MKDISPPSGPNHPSANAHELAGRLRHDHSRHVAVRDADAHIRHEKPLNAFMVDPRYLRDDAAKNLPPKRPLGQAAAPASEPVRFHNQVATFGSMDRIRRPRTVIPVTNLESHEERSLFERVRHRAGITAAAAMAAPGLAASKLAAAGRVVTDKVHALSPGPGRVHYSMTEGAAARRYGIPEPWFRAAAPLAVLLLIAGAGFWALHGTSSLTGGASHGGGDGSANGGNMPVPGGRGSAGSPQNGGTASPGQATVGPQAAGSPGATAPNTTLQPAGNSSHPGGTAVPVGGMGGAADPPPSPIISTGSNTPGQALPVGNAGSLLPVVPTPLPVTVTVPPVNSSADGKTLLDSSGTTLTAN
jgi:hypothetical protein